MVWARCHFAGLASAIDCTIWSSGDKGAARRSVSARTVLKASDQMRRRLAPGAAEIRPSAGATTCGITQLRGGGNSLRIRQLIKAQLGWIVPTVGYPAQPASPANGGYVIAYHAFQGAKASSHRSHWAGSRSNPCDRLPQRVQMDRVKARSPDELVRPDEALTLALVELVKPAG